MMMSMGWDIGLAPLLDIEFNRCKSHIKWMEYSMSKTPVLASRVYPYYEKIDNKDVIVDGKTGFLFSDENEFKTKLKKLILDIELRKKIGDNAYNYIIKKWQYRDNIKKMVKILNQYL
jgi:spore maturation protein CgeB